MSEQKQPVEERCVWEAQQYERIAKEMSRDHGRDSAPAADARSTARSLRDAAAEIERLRVELDESRVLVENARARAHKYAEWTDQKAARVAQLEAALREIEARAIEAKAELGESHLGMGLICVDQIEQTARAALSHDSAPLTDTVEP